MYNVSFDWVLIYTSLGLVILEIVINNLIEFNVLVDFILLSTILNTEVRFGLEFKIISSYKIMIDYQYSRFSWR